jgi:hypothetical protein
VPGSGRIRRANRLNLSPVTEAIRGLGLGERTVVIDPRDWVIWSAGKNWPGLISSVWREVGEREKRCSALVVAGGFSLYFFCKEFAFPVRLASNEYLIY